MSETNCKTIESYNNRIQEYIDGTPQVVEGYVKTWIDEVLVGLEQDAEILEIGSAFGRDAAYIETSGFKVKRTDATKGFVELLISQGFDANELNVITDEITGPNDLVFADAVLLHFNREEAAQVCGKVYRSLNSRTGKFALSLKNGEGEEWSDAKLGEARYFCYWEKDSARKLLEDQGFSRIEVTQAGVTEGVNPKWLHIIAYK